MLKQFYWEWVVENFNHKFWKGCWSYGLLNSYCWFPITNFVKHRDCSTSGFSLYALFRSAVVKYFPFKFVRFTWIGSMGWLPLESSISELRHLASRTFSNEFPLARIKNGFLNVFRFGCSSFLTGEMISFCSNLFSNLLILSCKWIGTLLVRCFWKLRQVLEVDAVLIFSQHQI